MLEINFLTKTSALSKELKVITDMSDELRQFVQGERMRINQKAPQGAAVIAASMHGFASCGKFKSHMILTLTLDRVKVTSTYTVYVGLPAYPTMLL